MSDVDKRKHLRKFGLVMSVPFLLLGAWLAYKGRPAAPYFLGIGGIFALFGLAFPRALAPVEKAWMWFAMKLQIVTSTIILSIAFYLILTPMGLVRRLLGHDPLELRRSTDETYWKGADKDGSASRPHKPY